MLLINNLIIPTIIMFIMLYGYIKKINVYDAFLNGCIDEILFSGFNSFSPHLLSMALLRPISGNATLGVMQDIFKLYGPDSFNGFIASLLQGSTETTVYVIALYYGSIGVKKIRNTLKIGLIVDLFGILLAFLIGYFFYKQFM